jgi:hypothetical protein
LQRMASSPFPSSGTSPHTILTQTERSSILNEHLPPLAQYELSDMTSLLTLELAFSVHEATSMGYCRNLNVGKSTGRKRALFTARVRKFPCADLYDTWHNYP